MTDTISVSNVHAFMSVALPLGYVAGFAGALLLAYKHAMKDREEEMKAIDCIDSPIEPFSTSYTKLNI